MLKLYKSNYSDDELLTMAKHCLDFCPIPVDKRLREGCFSCKCYRICRDFQRLGEYCLEKVNNGECSDC